MTYDVTTNIFYFYLLSALDWATLIYGNILIVVVEIIFAENVLVFCRSK